MNACRLLNNKPLKNNSCFIIIVNKTKQKTIRNVSLTLSASLSIPVEFILTLLAFCITNSADSSGMINDNESDDDVSELVVVVVVEA